MAKKKRTSSACRVTTTHFKTKRGKTVAFKSRTGNCAPKRRKTSHLASHKRALGAAARACAGKSKKAFQSCIRTRLK